MENNTHQEGLQMEADINWEQVRNQAAVAALQGIVSSSTHWNASYHVIEGISGPAAAREAVCFADSLVAELKKKRENKGK